MYIPKYWEAGVPGTCADMSHMWWHKESRLITGTDLKSVCSVKAVAIFMKGTDSSYRAGFFSTWQLIFSTWKIFNFWNPDFLLANHLSFTQTAFLISFYTSSRSDVWLRPGQSEHHIFQFWWLLRFANKKKAKLCLFVSFFLCIFRCQKAAFLSILDYNLREYKPGASGNCFTTQGAREWSYPRWKQR